MDKEMKPFWASKTLWVNVIVVIASITGALGLFDLTPELQATIIGVVMGIVNIALRFVTDKKVSMT